MCTARLFSQGSTSLHSNFTWTESSPSTLLGVRKLGFDTIPECDGQTDGRTDGYAVEYTAHAKQCYAMRDKNHHHVCFLLSQDKLYLRLFLTVILANDQPVTTMQYTHPSVTTANRFSFPSRWPFIQSSMRWRTSGKVAAAFTCSWTHSILPINY